MKFFYRLCHLIFQPFFRIVYSHRVYGIENICPGPAIIAPNHNSYYDPPLVGASWPGTEEIHYIARGSLFNQPVLKTIIRSLNAHPVRGSANDVSTFKMVKQLLDEHKKVVIFPEGVRSWNGKMSPIKSGIAMLALRSKCPIIPVYLHGTYTIWNRQRLFPKLCGKTACVFGKPINVQPYERMDKKDAQDAITQVIQESIDNLKLWYESGAKGKP